MKTQNIHTTNKSPIQTKFDWLIALLPVDFWLTACDARSSYRQVRFTCASRRRTKIQLSYASSSNHNLPTTNYQLQTTIYQLFTMLTNIILFNHSFGGLSPPNGRMGTGIM